MKNLILLILTVLAAQFSFAQASKNMSQIAHLTFNDDMSDVWGYVDGNGNEYGLLGLNNSVKIVSLATPSNPTVLFTIPGANSIWRDLKTHGSYAYVTNETSGGILIIDLSGLPSTVNYKDTVMNGLNTAHNLYIDNGFMYVVGSNTDNGGISIFDVATDPWHPTKVGAFTSRYVHDVYVRNNTAYAAEINNGLLEIIDVTNPALPIVKGSKSYVNSFTHNTWLNDAGTVCFTTDELAQAYIYAWDVTNPSNISELGSIRSSQSSGAATPHNTHVLNDFLVTSYYKDGVTVVDAARPNNLIEIGYFDTNNLVGGGTDGCWGAYPFLPSGIVLATDINDGFFVLDPVYNRACYLEGTVTDSTTGLPISNATITIQSISVTAQTNGSGNYATGTSDPGTYQVTYERFGYDTKTITTTLTNGTLVTQDVQLVATPTVSYTITVQEAGSGNPIGQAMVQAVSGGFSLDYNTNTSGVVNDPSFVEGTYSIVAGKWGYITKEVTATADAGNTNLVIELEKGYYDDFYFDFGWLLFGNANAGEWERGEPVGTTFGNQQMNPDLDVPNDIGDQCYVTGNGGGDVGDDDVDNGVTILKSPIFDLTGYNQPVVRFYRWFANDGGFGNPNDTLQFVLSNGISSVALTKIHQTANFWVLDTFIVSNYITPTASMQLEARCGDYSPGHLVEGALDLFSVVEGNGVGVDDPVMVQGPRLVIYPNPVKANSLVTYDFGQPLQNTRASFQLTDIQGKLIWSQDLKQSVGEFQLKTDLKAGIYLGSLYLGSEKVKTFKVVVGS
ncbi:MAG: choice-of-anchor B family protein [Bacteroidia bacterium]|nr:choice-of-anchor B family protein [Bacteroidia bacterium]